MSDEVKTNYLLEVVWFTAKAINFGLWVAFAVIVAYYLFKHLKERFWLTKKEEKPKSQ